MKKSAKGTAEESGLSRNIEDYVGAVEAAALLGINYRTFIRLDERQGFTQKQFGRRLYYLREDLLRFVKTQGAEKAKELRILETPKISFEEFEIRFKKEAKHCKPLLKEEVYRFFKDFKKRSADDKNSLMNMLQTVLVDQKTSSTHVAVSASVLDRLPYWFKLIVEDVVDEKYTFLHGSVHSISNSNGACNCHKITIIDKENIEKVLRLEFDNSDYSSVLADFLEFISSGGDQGIMKSCYQRGQEKIRSLNLTYSEFDEIARITLDDEKIKKMFNLLWAIFRDGILEKKYREE